MGRIAQREGRNVSVNTLVFSTELDGSGFSRGMSVMEARAKATVGRMDAIARDSRGKFVTNKSAIFDEQGQARDARGRFLFRRSMERDREIEEANERRRNAHSRYLPNKTAYTFDPTDLSRDQIAIRREYQARQERKASGAARRQDIVNSAAMDRTEIANKRDHAAALKRVSEVRLHQTKLERQADAAAEAKRNSLGGRTSAFMGSVAGRFLGVGAAIGAAYGTARFIASSVQADIAIQRIQNTLKATSGSAVKAASDFAFLRQESDRIGFAFLDSGTAFARFNVAAQAANLSSEETRKIFTAVQESSVVMGLTTEQTSASFLALEQMLSKGTVMSQELRLQLGNAMPGAMNTFADALGVTLPKLYEMVEGGELLSKDVLPKFAAQLQKKYTLSDDLKTVAQDINKITTEWAFLKASMAESFRPLTKGTLGFLSDLMKGPGAIAEQIEYEIREASGQSPVGDVTKKESDVEYQKRLKDQAAAKIDEINKSNPFLQARLKMAALNKEELKETQKINAEIYEQKKKNAIIGETDEEKRVRLLKEIKKLESLSGLSDRGNANRRLDILKAGGELLELDNKKEKEPKSGNFTPRSDSLTAVGNFLGSSKGVMESLAQRQLGISVSMEKHLKTIANKISGPSGFSP